MQDISYHDNRHLENLQRINTLPNYKALHIDAHLGNAIIEL